MTSTSMFLVRHGQTDWNSERRLMGARGIPLNEIGRAQLRAVAEALPRALGTRICTSPLVRARQSAEIVATAIGAPLEEDERLLEVVATPWEGMMLDDIAAHVDFVAARKRRITPPGFEPLSRVQARAVDCIESRWPHAGEGPVVLVSHGDVVRAALAHYLGLDLDQFHRFAIDNGSICRLDRIGRRTVVGLINHVPFVPAPSGP